MFTSWLRSFCLWLERVVGEKYDNQLHTLIHPEIAPSFFNFFNITSIHNTLALYQHKIKSIHLVNCREVTYSDYSLDSSVKESMITLKTYCQMNKIIFISDGLI